MNHFPNTCIISPRTFSIPRRSVDRSSLATGLGRAVFVTRATTAALPTGAGRATA